MQAEEQPSAAGARVPSPTAACSGSTPTAHGQQQQPEQQCLGSGSTPVGAVPVTRGVPPGLPTPAPRFKLRQSRRTGQPRMSVRDSRAELLDTRPSTSIIGVASDPNPAIVGLPVTLTGTVLDESGAAPTGVVRAVINNKLMPNTANVVPGADGSTFAMPLKFLKVRMASDWSMLCRSWSA